MLWRPKAKPINNDVNNGVVIFPDGFIDNLSNQLPSDSSQTLFKCLGNLDSPHSSQHNDESTKSSQQQHQQQRSSSSITTLQK
jgi:hypothetical protein